MGNVLKFRMSELHPILRVNDSTSTMNTQRRNFSSITEWSGVGGVAGWGNYEIKKNRRYVLRPGLNILFKPIWSMRQNWKQFLPAHYFNSVGQFWAGKHRTYLSHTSDTKPSCDFIVPNQLFVGINENKHRGKFRWEKLKINIALLI